MRNPNRGSGIELMLMAAAGGGVAAVLGILVPGNLVTLFVSGTLYGVTSYMLWWCLLSCAGSLFFDEDEDEPEKLTWQAGMMSFLLPLGELIAIICALVLVCIGCVFGFKDATKSEEEGTLLK